MKHMIYQIINKLNGKKYIGIHSGEESDMMKKYFGSGKLLIQAYEKYGKENFSYKILYYCKSRDDVLNKEKEILTEDIVKDRENYYNITRGGGAPPSWLGKKHSKETIEKCRISKIGDKNPMYGKETWQKGKYGELNGRSKQVVQMDLDGNEIRVWGSMYMVERELGFSASHISKCCRGLLHKHKDFKWKYFGE